MRTRKTVVILVSGKAGSGKSTVVDVLSKKLNQIPDLRVMSYGFAEPLKYIAKAFMTWNGEKDDKGRKLLQQIGAIGREYNPDVWVKHFLNQLDRRAEVFPFNFALISDWRFPNEFAYLKNNPLLDIVTIRVFGRGGLQGDNSFDVSENSLPEALEELLEPRSYKEFEPMLWYDYMICNNTDLDELEKKSDIILSSISKQYIVE